MNNPLISILMPTFKDSDTIIESIESVLIQSYSNWELIIVNDLYDQTDEIIQNYSDKRIKYFHNVSSVGQLNALLYGITHLSGDYITILHSDDLFSSPTSLENCVHHFQDSLLDGIYSDLIIIDDEGTKTNCLKTAPYLSNKSIQNIFLLRGSNIISDFFFVSHDAFFSVVFNNYLLWNMPYWFLEKNNTRGLIEKSHNVFGISNDCFQILHLKKVKPWYKYRVYSNNYITSDVGKFETFNGMLRTTLILSKYFDEYPFSRLPFITEFMIKNCGISVLRNRPYSSSYLELVTSLYSSIYGKCFENKDIYIEAILDYYSNFPSPNKLIIPEQLIRNCNNWYRGCDARKFYIDITNIEELDPLYKYILKNAHDGFSKLIITNSQDFAIIRDTLKFLNILARVEISTL